MNESTGLTAPPRAAGTRSAAPPRELDTRETEQRPQAWVNPGMIPSPIPRPGTRFKWVRNMVNGSADQQSVARHLMQGYVVTTAQDVPELNYLVSAASRWGNKDTAVGSTVEFGGLLLMHTSEAIATARQNHYTQQHQEQVYGIEAALTSSNDSRMPTIKNRSKTTFGKNAVSAD